MDFFPRQILIQNCKKSCQLQMFLQLWNISVTCYKLFVKYGFMQCFNILKNCFTISSSEFFTRVSGVLVSIFTISVISVILHECSSTYSNVFVQNRHILFFLFFLRIFLDGLTIYYEFLFSTDGLLFYCLILKQYGVVLLRFRCFDSIDLLVDSFIVLPNLSSMS